MNPLATARQLWRLNKDGRLALRVSEGEIAVGVISTTVADTWIKAGPLAGSAVVVSGTLEAQQSS